MGLARSTFYDVAPVPLEPAELVARIGAICDEFECYGYRRVGAALRHQGVVVNSKKLRRLMREHDLQPKRRRRYVVTTDSDHAGPIFPDLAKDKQPAGLTASKLMADTRLPLDWRDQRAALGFPDTRLPLDWRAQRAALGFA
jgi:transposase InsO family protein